jgi:3-hydroxyisobutyrate dehydrogenase-like beta-hydroxyacid dehydrogenase
MTARDAADQDSLALIGFGEAAEAFLQGWRSERPGFSPRAYDIKAESSEAAVREAKLRNYAAAGARDGGSVGQTVSNASIVFSLVTADQAHAAAAAVARVLPAGALFLDCNSCSPGAKRKSAALIEAAGGRYVDVAVMSPVHPGLHRTPLLISGPHTAALAPQLEAMGMKAKVYPGEVGAASSIKMVRSIMMKGLEALALECVLAGRRAGVDRDVLDSLDATYPGFDWKGKAAYMLERAMTHGLRRAAEMREVAITVEELGLENGMSKAIVDWQQAVGDLRLKAGDIGEDYVARADAILAGLPSARRGG